MRLTFAEPDAALQAGQRLFSVSLQGKQVIQRIDILAESKGTMHSLTKTISHVEANDGGIQIELSEQKNSTLLSGIELIMEGLPIGSPHSPAIVPGRY